MKNLRTKALFLAVAFFGIGTCAYATNDSFEVSANPLGLLFGFYNANLFYGVTPEHGVGLNTGYFNYGITTLSTISGLTMGPAYRYHFGGMGGHGAVIGAKAPLGFYTLGTVKITRVPALFEALYRWNWSGFTLALGGGFGYAYTSVSGIPSATLSGFTTSGAAYDITATIGYVF